MSPARKADSVSLRLTSRALDDLQEIERYSIENWGKQAAARYISDIEAGLHRLQQMPGLLRKAPGFHAALRFYHINKHVLVCDVHSNTILVLTVIHGSMDIVSCLSELEPTLEAEVELLHRKLHRKK